MYLQVMDIHEARRLAVLELLARPPYSGVQSKFAEDTGISRSYLTRMLKPKGEKDAKGIGDDMAVKIEKALNLRSGELLAPVLAAHHVAEPQALYRTSPNGQTPVISRNTKLQLVPIVPPSLYRLEDLMKLGEDLPAAFRLEIDDDAMAPMAGAGTVVDFTTTRAATFGDAVLVKDAQGTPHFRRMCQVPNGWEARPTNDAYATLHSEQHQLTVLAVFDGLTRKGSWADLES